MNYCQWATNFYNMSEESICPPPMLQSSLNRSAKDKFIMFFELPHILKKRQKIDKSINIDYLQMSIYGTVVPDISVPQTDVRYQGQNLHLSTYARPSNPALTINFVVDNEYKNYYLLWKWLDTMNLALANLYGGTGPRSTDEITQIGNQFEYQTPVTIVALNEYESPVLQFTYTKCFITRLGGIQYSYRDGALIESSADFYFSQLTITNNPTVK